MAMQKQTLDAFSWEADSACFEHPATGINPDLFYGFTPNDIVAAKEICATCPVSNDCLAYGLGKTALKVSMVYGGYTQQERLVMTQQQIAA